MSNESDPLIKIYSQEELNEMYKPVHVNRIVVALSICGLILLASNCAQIWGLIP